MKRRSKDLLKPKRTDRPFAFRSKLTFMPGATPKQRAYSVRMWWRNDATKRAQCDMLEFWLDCPKARCRRHRGCEGDMHACFTRRWRALPEEDKVFVRSVITAARDGLRGEALERAAEASFVEHFQRIADLERHSQAFEAEPAAAPQPRIRTL
jgi:hypothetical protein